MTSAGAEATGSGTVTAGAWATTGAASSNCGCWAGGRGVVRGEFGEAFIHAVPDTIIFPDDELVVSGKIKDLERFSAI